MSHRRGYDQSADQGPDQSRNRESNDPRKEGEEGDSLLERQSDETRQIIETGGVTPTKGRHTIHCLSIVGQVEGHYILPPQNKTTKYEHVIPQLVAIQEDPEIEGLIMILNTVGGDVEAGLAIAELVASMRKPTVSLVLGGGHSIGVPLAVSARRSFIVPSATMTIHPVRMNGVVLGVPQTLSYFDKMQERITRFVEENSGMEPDNFRRLMMNTGELVMDVGTVLDGERAVEEGLIDYLGGLHDAIECLYDMIDQERMEERARHRGRKSAHGRESRSYRSGRGHSHSHSPSRREEPRQSHKVSPRRYAASIEDQMQNADYHPPIPEPGSYEAADRRRLMPYRWGDAYGRPPQERRNPIGDSYGRSSGRRGPTSGSATGRERQNSPPRIHPSTENRQDRRGERG